MWKSIELGSRRSLASAKCRTRPTQFLKTTHRVSSWPNGSSPSPYLFPQQYRFISSATTSPPKTVKFTAESYPEIQRNAQFAQVTPEHITALQGIIGADHVLNAAPSDTGATVSEDDLAPYNEDWMRKYRGQSKLVLRPKTTEQISQILAYCHEHSLAVVPQGGNTGLVGGSVPVFDEIVISLSRMNQILSFNEASGTLVVEAGCILEVADHYLAKRHHIFPLDLGAKGSCHVGGNIATNAGGLRLLRYGSLHGTVLGVETVLPNGQILDDLCTLRKNNTGYDLKQLFIGSEGTLGIVTKVAIQCPARPAAVNVAYLGLESYEQVQVAFQEAKKQLGEILSAFELMDDKSQELVAKVKQSDKPLESDHKFYCLIETSGSNDKHDYEKLEAFLEDVMTREIVVDGTVAQDETQRQSLWTWRESVAEVSAHWGGVYKYDVSIPMPDLYQLVDDTQKRLEEAGLVSADDDAFPVIDSIGYGHMGDLNLHLNVVVRRYDKRVEETLEPFVYEWIQKRQGSISAEHGLGLAKKKYVQYSRDEPSLHLMRQLKSLFDPKGIMNPYKYV